MAEGWNSDPVRYLTQKDATAYNNDGSPGAMEGNAATGPGWYFYDETWAFMYGPYKTEEEAREACKKYADTL